MSKFIVIEGLIGVGKTSLCRLLNEKWGTRLVLEPCEANPFLANFYADPKHYAFPTQMFYLAARYQQQLDLLQKELFDDIIVADYLFEKDRLFAEQTLNEEELSLYTRFTSLLSHHVARPDFIVFLDAPTNVVMSRIHRRSIDSEQVIAPEYLDSLRARYYKLWQTWDKCPIYMVDTTEINYVDNKEDANRILDLIQSWITNEHPKEPPKPAFMTDQNQLSLF